MNDDLHWFLSIWKSFEKPFSPNRKTPKLCGKCLSRWENHFARTFSLHELVLYSFAVCYVRLVWKKIFWNPVKKIYFWPFSKTFVCVGWHFCIYAFFADRCWKISLKYFFSENFFQFFSRMFANISKTAASSYIARSGHRCENVYEHTAPPLRSSKNFHRRQCSMCLTTILCKRNSGFTSYENFCILIFTPISQHDIFREKVISS